MIIHEKQDRYQKIGASVVAGLVRDYYPQLVKEGFDNPIYNEKIEKMWKNIGTSYSLLRQLNFSREQSEKYQKYIYHYRMERGLDCEDEIKNQFLRECQIDNIEVTDFQKAVVVRCEGLNGTPAYDIIATLDYLLSIDSEPTNLECKTTDIYLYQKAVDKDKEAPFNYILQTQMQMRLHKLKKTFLALAGVHTEEEDGEDNGEKFINVEHQVLDTTYYLIEYDEYLANMALRAIALFNYDRFTNPELILAKPQHEKNKPDLEIDKFMDTIEKEINEELVQKMLDYEAKKEALKKLEGSLDVLKAEIEGDLKKELGEYKHLNGLNKGYSIKVYHTQPSFLTTIDIKAKITKCLENFREARKLKVGTAKSIPALRFKVKEAKK